MMCKYNVRIFSCQDICRIIHKNVAINSQRRFDWICTIPPKKRRTYWLIRTQCGKYAVFLHSSPILLDKSIKAWTNLATGVNVVSVGSPSRILIVRRISFGMTTLPSSSMRRTIPVAFIYNSPVNVIFGIRRIMRRNALKKVFREYYLHNALIYSRFCNKNHSKSPFHKRCRKDTWFRQRIRIFCFSFWEIVPEEHVIDMTGNWEKLCFLFVNSQTKCNRGCVSMRRFLTEV